MSTDTDISSKVPSHMQVQLAAFAQKADEINAQIKALNKASDDSLSALESEVEETTALVDTTLGELDSYEDEIEKELDVCTVEISNEIMTEDEGEDEE